MLDSLNFLFQNSLVFRLTSLLIVGLCIGSFLNVVVYRLPIMLQREWRNQCLEVLGDECKLAPDLAKFNLNYPSSHCPSCKAKIPVWTNIPLIGFLLLAGKCNNCKIKISWRYPLVELLSGILFVAAGYVFSDPWTVFASLIFIAALLSLMLIDLDTFLLPDELTLPLLWLGLLFNLHGMFSASLTNAVIGAVVGYLSLWSLYWIFKLLTKREGMGYGDFKLLAALGAWLGWQNLVSVLLVSSCLGILYALVLRFSGRLDRGNPIPFGPFLGGAGIVTLLFVAHLFPILIY